MKRENSTQFINAMDNSTAIELITLTRCHSEGRCILSSVIIQSKVDHATDALHLLLQQEQQLLQLIADVSSNDVGREVQSIGAVLKCSLVMMRKRLIVMMRHISQLLNQVHSNLSSLKNYYEQNITLANELSKLGLDALGDSKKRLYLGEKLIYDNLNSLLKKATTSPGSESNSNIMFDQPSSTSDRTSFEGDGSNSIGRRVSNRDSISNGIRSNPTGSPNLPSKRKQGQIFSS